MAKDVANMIHEMLDSFARSDPIHAAAVVRSDKEVDKNRPRCATWSRT